MISFSVFNSTLCVKKIAIYYKNHNLVGNEANNSLLNSFILMTAQSNTHYNINLKKKYLKNTMSVSFFYYYP